MSIDEAYYARLAEEFEQAKKFADTCGRENIELLSLRITLVQIEKLYKNNVLASCLKKSRKMKGLFKNYCGEESI